MTSCCTGCGRPSPSTHRLSSTSSVPSPATNCQYPPSGSASVAPRLPVGSYWRFVAGEGPLEVDDRLWVVGDGRPHPVQQLVMQGLVSRGGGSFSWLLKKIR